MERRNILFEFDDFTLVKDGYKEEGCIEYSQCNLPVQKTHNPEKMISLDECWKVIQELDYGTLCMNTDGYPHVIGMNHILYQNRIFFHCGLKGYKLRFINEKVTMNFVQDLGINPNIGTHNHRSVSIFGTLKKIDDMELKKDVLLTLIQGTKHPYHDRMLNTTNVLELEIEYIFGKAHIY
ncbi:MAG: pyridoxamine 5'-phosphate oxidase family protein [Floccifex sp.]